MSASDAHELCGISARGIYIPYFGLDGTPVMDGGKPYGRLRLDVLDGERKYHQAAGSGVHAYIPPGLGSAELTHYLIIVEGEFKAAALFEAGFPAVGISGFFGFATKGGESLVPELTEVIQHRRPSVILFVGDNDTAFNFQFSVAAIRLAELLPTHAVCLPRIPTNELKGADDCRSAMREEFPYWWQRRMEDAVANIGRSPAALAVRLLEREAETMGKESDIYKRQLVKKLVTMAACMETEPLYQNEVIQIAVERLNVARSAFKKEVREKRREMKSEAKIAFAEADGACSAPVPAVDMGATNHEWTRAILKEIGPQTFFHGENICQAVKGRLRPMEPAELCSFVDNPSLLRLYKITARGDHVAVQLSETQARILLGMARQAPELLRPVEVMSSMPALMFDGMAAELISGYSAKHRALAGEAAITLPQPEEAVTILCNLLRDYNFTSLGDMGRGIAFLLTPTLTMGGFLGQGRAPHFVIEKNEASAGGSLFIRLNCLIHGVRPNPISEIDDSKRFAETMSERLLAGDTICYVDNARGKGLQKAPWYESLLTEPTYSCRMIYRQGTVDVTRRVFAVSTNGALLSVDLGTRTVKIAITRRPDEYPWHEWPEGSIEAHVVANRSLYLGAIYSLIMEWVKCGCPAGDNLIQFRYREWERACAWILQRYFPGLPLLDSDHKEAQKQLANADHDLLRNLFRTHCERENRPEMTASTFAELALNTGQLQGNQEQVKLRLGRILKDRFPKDGIHKFDSGRFNVTRIARKGASRDVTFYAVEQSTP